MKTSTVACVLMLVAAVALIASPAFAEPISTKDSADFNVKAFEGNEVDPTLEWTKSITQPNNVTVATDGNSVTWTTIPYAKISWSAAGGATWPTTDPAVGFTVEFSAKIISQASSGTSTRKAPLVCLASGHTGRYDLYVSSFGTMQRQDTGSGTTENLMDTNSNMDDFHVFRIVREPDVGAVTGKAYYYRDGILISDPLGVVGLETVSPETLLTFGDTSDDMNGSVSIDYVRFDTTGAYAPVPEPSTIALLVTGLIGLLAYAWRKRK